MSVTRPEIADQLRGLVGSYLGRQLSASEEDKLLGDEIGLRGGDSIQFIQEVEEYYSISLTPLINKHIKSDRLSLLQRILHLSANEYSDFTINELEDFIISELELR